MFQAIFRYIFKEYDICKSRDNKRNNTYSKIGSEKKKSQLLKGMCCFGLIKSEQESKLKSPS